jgi:myosin heavy subunit
LLKAFSGLDFTAEEVEGVMAMAAGVLSLGNLDFSGDGKEGSKVAGPAVADVARLWGVSEEALRRAVTVRTIEVRGTTAEIPLTSYSTYHLLTHYSLLTTD